MHLLMLEPFYGGSHRDVADSLVRHSRHRIDLLTLPARFWKWRMRGAALHFARAVADPAAYSAVICTSLMSVSDLKALWGRQCPPVLFYLHETQLSYPLPDGEEYVDRDGPDLHFAFTDLTNLLSCDLPVWNSRSHLERFCERLPRFLKRLPDSRPRGIAEEIVRRSVVCHPGITVTPSSDRAEPGGLTAARPHEGPPLVIWNHRWEFDKRPEAFFNALAAVKERGAPFRLALLGESSQVKPTAFLDARKQFADEVVQFGYVDDGEEYRSWLQSGSIVMSTAAQENFGISILEAIAHGCHPLLPARLSYPEIIPERFHPSCLYGDDDELVRALGRLLAGPEPPHAPAGLVAHARSYAWESRIEAFDELFERVAGMHG